PKDKRQTDIPYGEGRGDQRNEAFALVLTEVTGTQPQLDASQEQNDPEHGTGEQAKDELDRAAAEERQDQQQRSQDNGRATRARAEGDVPCHPTGTVTHRNAAQYRTSDVHHTRGNGDAALRHRTVRKEPVVFLTNGDNRIT